MKKVRSSFLDWKTQGYFRLAVAVPETRVADVEHNVEQILGLMQQASQQGANLVLFPELCLSSYSCEDLFQQEALQGACWDGLERLIQETKKLPIVGVVGLPVVFLDSLYNCAAVFARGKLFGLVPKTYLPNYREFYEKRQFASGHVLGTKKTSDTKGNPVLFGAEQIFMLPEFDSVRFHVEICEDVWAPIPPSSYAALAGATILLNLSASNITVGKSEYRHNLVSNQSARCLAAYAYSAAGPGESTTDLAWDGHAMVYENGKLLVESQRFCEEEQLIITDIDMRRISQERQRQTSFADSKQFQRVRLTDTFHSSNIFLDTPELFTSGEMDLTTAQSPWKSIRHHERFPYVPADKDKRDIRCYEAYQIQVQGLVKRLRSSKIKKVCIGVSGGLDSTQALLVAAKAFDLLGYSRKGILGYTMPGFATSNRTLQQAHDLMKAIGCSAKEIDIRPSCEQMLRDIEHPYAKGERGPEVYDVTFENVQAGERTSHLFRLANHNGALVLGTGDLSELALGWCTYGVGDHMSHYNVNASVPKTLIQFLIRWVAERKELGQFVSDTLYEILDTEISPELVPGDDASGEQPAQKTEDIIGPYEIQDFYLYYILRYGFLPTRVLYMCLNAWHEKYTLEELYGHLRTFLYRFYQISQFKRTCVPNGPKIGSGGSLSPRGDYRAPADAEAEIWLAQLELVWHPLDDSLPGTDEG